MTYFTTTSHTLHDIQWELYNGQKEECSERPTRVGRILESLASHGFEQGSLLEIDYHHLQTVHDQDYLDFLQALAQQPYDKIYPSVWNYSQYLNLNPNKIEIQAGKYLFDTFTPFTKQIWEVARESVDVAYSAAHFTLQNQQTSYALCRPPGHHATRNQAGGYCYLANASIVAAYLVDQGFKPAILDIDYHHGNGAQEIWYESDEVLTVSIHQNPLEKFPYYSGLENETGLGKGNGWNQNYCFEKDITIQNYLPKLNQALDLITVKGCDFLIISAGFDTFKDDPICDAKLEIQDYKTIAERINQLKLPTTILQEGGYNLEAIGDCVTSFLSGFSI